MATKVRIPGKVAGKVFVGALWELDGKKLEITCEVSDDGTIECETETGEQLALNVNDFLRGSFLRDKYEDYDKEPDEEP